MKILRFFCYALVGLVVFILSTSVTIGFLLKDQSTIPCPDVAGLDFHEGKRLVEQRGLSMIIMKYEPKKDLPYNRIIFQKPEPAMPVKKGRGVAVILSDGPKPVNIPLVVGRSVPDAEAFLREQTIKVKKIIYVPGPAEGKVVAQIPAGGENILDEDGMVLIAGGREKRYYVMPDIPKADYGSVIDEMRKKHINYKLTYEDLFEKLEPGPRTTIAPRTIFSEDSVLEIKVNAGG